MLNFLYIASLEKDNLIERCYFVIPAGGKGLRFGADIPKQFVQLAGMPVLYHTLRRIAPFAEKIVLALPNDYLRYWEELVGKFSIDIPHQVVEGGATRFQSVKAALQVLPCEGLVAVHDAVRPFVSQDVMRNLILAAQKSGAVVPYLPMTDSIRTSSKTDSKLVDRTSIVRVQTPQVFDLSILKKAYAQQESPLFTDDASVYESFTNKVPVLEQGNVENIKITTQQDLVLGEYLLKAL